MLAYKYEQTIAHHEKEGMIFMAVTINDIAERANVSPSTVSRVISNTGRISEETRQKVKMIMDEMGYYPNYIARSLVSKSTRTIGFFLPRAVEQVFNNPFMYEVIRGISLVASKNDYDILITLGERKKEEEMLKALIHGKKVDGLILLSSRVNDFSINFLKNEKIPFVVVGRPMNNENEVNWVNNDNIGAAYNATKHLIEIGHVRIGLIGGPSEHVVSIDRCTGYKKALCDHGIPVNEDYIIETEFLEEGGYKAVQHFLALKEPPTAIVLMDDLMAFGAIRALKDRRMKIPEDIALASFNNIPTAQFASPPLTSVDVNSSELGKTAMEILLDEIKSPKPIIKRAIIPFELIRRRSSMGANEI